MTYERESYKIRVLAAIGTDDQWEVLSFTIGDRQNQQAWQDLFEDLKQRDVKEIGL